MTLSTPTTQTTRSASLLLAIFASLFYGPAAAHALGTISTLAEFTRSIQNGEARMLRGVYVDGLFALPIVQQPSGSPAFVSRNDGEITEFGMAADYGNVGLLAHNDLSGRLFSGLATGQQVRLVYGNGRVETFVITDVFRYQALQPNSPYSSFRNLEQREGTVTAQQVFKRAYLGDRHVTFQTCIEAFGNSSWGRLFVIAVPVTDYLGFEQPGAWKYQ